MYFVFPLNKHVTGCTLIVGGDSTSILLFYFFYSRLNRLEELNCYYTSNWCIWCSDFMHFIISLSHVSIYGPLAVTICNHVAQHSDNANENNNTNNIMATELPPITRYITHRQRYSQPYIFTFNIGRIIVRFLATLHIQKL